MDNLLFIRIKSIFGFHSLLGYASKVLIQMLKNLTNEKKYIQTQTCCDLNKINT